MSQYSGKCDFADFIEIHGFDYVKRSKVYIGHDWDTENLRVIPGKRLNIESIKDCIPYYPHLISMSACDKESGVIYLTEKSWVDLQEERYNTKFQMSDYYREELRKEIEKYENM